MRTARRLGDLLALENRLGEAAEAARRLEWCEVEGAVDQALELAEEHYEAERAELEEEEQDESA